MHFPPCTRSKFLVLHCPLVCKLLLWDHGSLGWQKEEKKMQKVSFDAAAMSKFSLVLIHSLIQQNVTELSVLKHFFQPVWYCWCRQEDYNCEQDMPGEVVEGINGCYNTLLPLWDGGITRHWRWADHMHLLTPRGNQERLSGGGDIKTSTTESANCGSMVYRLGTE